ncbi:unnamed protein product, partial [Cochlearia groenlandica]
ATHSFVTPEVTKQFNGNLRVKEINSVVKTPCSQFFKANHINMNVPIEIPGRMLL